MSFVDYASRDSPAVKIQQILPIVMLLLRYHDGSASQEYENATVVQSRLLPPSPTADSCA
jgi:hypothetical protein